MLRQVRISNFKSIHELTMPLGRINVLIGENGAGKSNLLEAIALAGAAHADKLDNEFLASRGIRISPPTLMRSAFDKSLSDTAIEVVIVGDDNVEDHYSITNDNQPYSRWQAERNIRTSLGFDNDKYLKGISEIIGQMSPDDIKRFVAVLSELASSSPDSKRRRHIEPFRFTLPEGSKVETPHFEGSAISDFVIYSPENTSLRQYQAESQIEPLGIKGEGLLRLLSVLSHKKNKSSIEDIKSSLHLFEWFDTFSLSSRGSKTGPVDIKISDIYLDRTIGTIDFASANEGFLYLAFYFALFSSELTPKFFAVDNVDASLNPKLCSTLMRELNRLAVKHDKQAIITTHNPAILDGMNLDDDEQRLFVVDRNRSGQTRIRRVSKPSGQNQPKLSEAFLRGSLGGLPKGF